MAGNHDLGGVAAIVGGVAEDLGHGLGCIIQDLPDGHFRQQPVVHAHDDPAFVLQAVGNLLIASFQTAAVEPDDDRAVLLPFRVVYIELQTFAGVIVGLDRVRDVVDLPVALRAEPDDHQAQHKRDQKVLHIH